MTRLVVFSMVLEIFNNESVNSIFKYKLEYEFEYKLGRFNTWELVPDITDYKLRKISTFQRNLSTVFLRVLNIYSLSYKNISES